MNLRKWAKGKECQIRIPGVCNRDHTTTVLCHIRLAGLTGWALKAPDELAAIGCSSCHDMADGRIEHPSWIKGEVKLMFYEGVFRTQAMWLKERG